jgi:hypothetical protein
MFSERGVHDLGQRDVVRLELRAVHHDLDLPGGLPDQGHGAHAPDVLQAPLDDLVGERGGGLGREAGRVDADRDDRHLGEVDALDDGLLDLAGQIAPDRRDLAAHVLRGVDRGDLELELDDDVREALLGMLSMCGALDRVGGLLDLLGDVALDGLRRRALVARRDRDDGEFDVGKQIDLQRAI